MMGKVSMLVGFGGLLVSCAWADSVLEKNVGIPSGKDFRLTGLKSGSAGGLRGARRLRQTYGWGLIEAVRKGDAAEVQGLLDGGADPNHLTSDGIATPLIVATINDNVTVIGLLLSAGAIVGLRNSRGGTALEYGAVYGSAGAVKALLAAGANPNEFDDVGFTPIHSASAKGHTGVVQELVNAGGDISLRTAGTTLGSTALHIAARRSHLGVVRLLLSLGADVNSQNTKYNQSPLDRAAADGSGAILLALIEAGADVNRGDIDGDTALFVAAYFGHQEAIEVLLENGADKSLGNNRRATPRNALCQCMFASEVADECQVEACSNSPQRLIILLNP